MKPCQACGASNLTEAVFCSKCGSKINESYLFCVHCGKKVSGSNKFCKYCGREVRDILPPRVPVLSNTKVTQPELTFVRKTLTEKTLEPSRPKKSRKKLVITLSVVLPIVFLLAMLITLVAVFDKVMPDGLSAEQKKLVSSFGNPGEYMIIFDRESSKRVDMWLYPELERYFIFENGKYSGGKEVLNPDLKKDEIKVAPEDFVKGMKMDDVVKAVGEQPQKNADSKSGITTLIFYNGLLTVAFNKNEEIINITRTKEIK